MTCAPHPEDPLAGDDEWGAAPTHPQSGEAIGAGGATDDEWGPAAPLSDQTEPATSPDAGWTAEDPFSAEPTEPPTQADDDWEPAPPLPLGIPKASPKRSSQARGRRRTGERGGRRARREEEDRPPREPKPDRLPPTAEERLQIALKHAYRYLTKRDRTEAEVRAYLEKRETDPASLEAAIAELLELKYLDDERYVQRYVEDRRRLDGWGPVRITQGLRKMGVESTLIAPAIEAVAEESDEDDVSLATELVQRRFNRRPLEDDKDRQKALRAVVSKGHSLDVAYAAVRAYEERCAEDAGL